MVSNDYTSASSNHLRPLEFTHRDADAMEQLFQNEFLYEVRRKMNISKEEFKSCCKILAAHEYPPACNRILVYFSGHGSNGTLIFQDGEEFSFKDMIDIFKPTIANNESLAHMVRMFFIDACRGQKEEFGSEIVSKGGSKQFVADEANVLLAYACPPTYLSYGSSTGSRWTTCLVEALRGSTIDHSVFDILCEAHKLMWQSYHQSKPYQTAEFGSLLHQALYFKKEAKERKGKMHSK